METELLAYAEMIGKDVCEFDWGGSVAGNEWCRSSGTECEEGGGIEDDAC